LWYDFDVENTNNKTYVIGSVIIAVIIIFFSINASRCHGETCEGVKSETAKYQIFTKMNPEIINELVANNEIILLDVREDYEWDEGYIAGAKHIALGDINLETTQELPKNKPIYVYCRSGSRAGEAEAELRSLGFENAENIGGIAHWQERGGNLVR